MKLLLDMNVSLRLVHELQRRGHEAAHWSDIGDPRADDRVIMAWAADNGYAVVTHDLDFGTLLAVTSGGRPSVVQVRMRDLLSPSYLDRLTSALKTFQAEIEDGAFVVVEPLRARVRILPLT